MYKIRISDVENIGNLVEKKGNLYDTFEKSKNFYTPEYSLDPEISEFESIMEFIYMVRKKVEISKKMIAKYFHY